MGNTGKGERRQGSANNVDEDGSRSISTCQVHLQNRYVERQPIAVKLRLGSV